MKLQINKGTKQHDIEIVQMCLGDCSVWGRIHIGEFEFTVQAWGSYAKDQSLMAFSLFKPNHQFSGNMHIKCYGVGRDDEIHTSLSDPDGIEKISELSEYAGRRYANFLSGREMTHELVCEAQEVFRKEDWIRTLEQDARPILNNIIPNSKKYRDAGVECQWDNGRNGYEIHFYPPEKPWGTMLGFVTIKEAHIKILTGYQQQYKTHKFHLADTNSVIDAHDKLKELVDGAINSLGGFGCE